MSSALLLPPTEILGAPEYQKTANQKDNLKNTLGKNKTKQTQNNKKPTSNTHTTNPRDHKHGKIKTQTQVPMFQAAATAMPPQRASASSAEPRPRSVRSVKPLLCFAFCCRCPPPPWTRVCWLTGLCHLMTRCSRNWLAELLIQQQTPCLWSTREQKDICWPDLRRYKRLILQDMLCFLCFSRRCLNCLVSDGWIQFLFFLHIKELVWGGLQAMQRDHCPWLWKMLLHTCTQLMNFSSATTTEQKSFLYSRSFSCSPAFVHSHTHQIFERTSEYK